MTFYRTLELFMLKIGSIELDIPFIQAPLAGYTDWPMRILARRFGAPLTFTGVMLDQIALNRKALKKKLFELGDEPHPVGAQLLGIDPADMAAAAKVFEARGFDLIDLNFACPTPKVLRRARGGSLLTDPDCVLGIYRRVRDAVKCPVTMKLRIGTDLTDIAQDNFRRIVEGASSEGVDALIIHGRTVEQRYKGKADWDMLASVKRRFPKTTILGSGDLMDAKTAVERLRTSGLDGAIIARGAVGNPWIFQEIRAMWNGCELPPPPTVEEQGRVMIDHFTMICRLYEKKKNVPYFRKFATGYTRRHPMRKKVHLALMAAKTKDDFLGLMGEYYGIRANLSELEKAT
jgi:tRNA-dihydrouridine synthase B